MKGQNNTQKFGVSDTGIQLPDGAAPFQESTLPDGTLWTQFFRIPSGYLLRFPGLADFSVSSDGTEVLAFPADDVTAQTIEHLHMNQVLPLALSRQLKLVLHASAIEIQNFGVAFLGESGWGKSTLSASFSTSGYRFLTDDGLQIRKEMAGFFIDPSHPSIRLWADSCFALIPEATPIAPPLGYTSKLRLLAGEEVAYCNVARPLRSIYFLGEGKTKDISIERVEGRQTMIELVKHCFLLDVEEREMLRQHFVQLTDLAKSQLLFRLDYPRRYELLPLVRDAIIQHATTQL